MATQHGVLTRTQAITAGMSRRTIERRTSSGAWVHVLPSVYRSAAIPGSWLQFVTASWLWARHGAVVSHRAAALLHQLSGVNMAPAELWIPTPRHSPKGVVLHTTSDLQIRDVVPRNCLRVTSVARTLLDLGAVLPPTSVEQALEDALRRRLISVVAIRRRLTAVEFSGRRGPGTLRDILDARHASAAPTESVLETRLARLIRTAKLSPPIRQHPVMHRGRLVARLDFAYPDSLLAIECDGFRFHSGRREWGDDRKRSNVLAGFGWRVLRVTWDDVTKHPQEVVLAISSALGSGTFLQRTAKNGG